MLLAQVAPPELCPGGPGARPEAARGRPVTPRLGLVSRVTPAGGVRVWTQPCLPFLSDIGKPPKTTQVPSCGSRAKTPHLCDVPRTVGAKLASRDEIQCAGWARCRTRDGSPRVTPPDPFAFGLLHSRPQLLVGPPQGLALLDTLAQAAPQLAGLLALGLATILTLAHLALGLQQLPPQPVPGILQQAQLRPKLFCLGGGRSSQDRVQAPLQLGLGTSPPVSLATGTCPLALQQLRPDVGVLIWGRARWT